MEFCRWVPTSWKYMLFFVLYPGDEDGSRFFQNGSTYIPNYMLSQKTEFLILAAVRTLNLTALLLDKALTCVCCNYLDD
jgi:hypothetical protein